MIHRLTFPYRKKIVIGNGLFIVVGGVIMLTSKDSNSFEMIVVARFMIGIGAGKAGKWIQLEVVL